MAGAAGFALPPLTHYRRNAQTCLNVAQAFPVRELGEGHAKKLVPAREGLYLVIATVTFDALAELALWEKVREL